MRQRLSGLIHQMRQRWQDIAEYKGEYAETTNYQRKVPLISGLDCGIYRSPMDQTGAITINLSGSH